jgi:NADPH-dependent 2,4-dienoyl-CoA reductase/sulfur reductase-like enzyme
MSRCLPAGALALTLLASCGGRSVDCSPVFTPNGPWPKACVIEVPNGATVSENDAGTTIVTVDGGVVATYPPCPCPHP